MTDWTDEYAAAADRNERYALLREEAARLRDGAEEPDFFDPDAVADTVREASDGVDGHLVAFVANDFGLPVAFRPEGTGLETQDAVRRAILEEKYDDANPDLDAIRRRILDDHPGVHKALVAVVDGEDVRYHLPEGSNQTTNFLTVREMVGLVDYTTNSHQRDDMSITY